QSSGEGGIDDEGSPIIFECTHRIHHKSRPLRISLASRGDRNQGGSSRSRSRGDGRFMPPGRTRRFDADEVAKAAHLTVNLGDAPSETGLSSHEQSLFESDARRPGRRLRIGRLFHDRLPARPGTEYAGRRSSETSRKTESLGKAAP